MFSKLPKERSSFEIDFPIPVPPPVTKATLPEKSPFRKIDILKNKKM